MDIELVIKIPEEQYNTIKSDLYNTFPAEMKECGLEAIRNGTPLPKGHGDLVDYEEMKNNARKYGAYAEATLSHIKPKTIIEADKEDGDSDETD